MKIQGPGPSAPTSKVKKKGNDKDSSGESFGSIMSDEAQPDGGVNTTQSIAKIDSLLAVQSVEDPTEKAAKQRAKIRSHAVLHELDKVRMGMLNGSLTVGNMIDMADVVASHRDKITDPQLTGLMDEIDLRAQVELAKMRVALDRWHNNRQEAS